MIEKLAEQVRAEVERGFKVRTENGELSDRLRSVEASRDTYRDAARRARTETIELMEDVKTLQYALRLAYRHAEALQAAFRFTENADDLQRDRVALAS